MSTLRHPVGPQPPQVYWRRRLVVSLGLLAIIVIIVLIIVRPGAGDPGTETTPDPTASASAEGETGEPGTDAEAAACTTDQVVVTAVTDSDVYAVDQQPLLSLSLRNTGADACTLPVGADVQEFVITSGTDRIWASTDCQEPSEPVEVVLDAGETLSSEAFAWSRTRSTPNDCAATRPPVTAGGATYRLAVSVGEFVSESDRPFILN